MKTIKLTKKNHKQVIDKAIQALSENQLVIYPTETCYGIAIDATQQPGIDKLLHYKTKRANKPLSIAVCDEQMADRYAELNHVAKNIFSNFLPGPITIVCRGRNKLAKGVQSSSGTLGIRLPDYPLILELIKAFGHPITATSATASYKKNPYSINDVLVNISNRQKNLIGLIIDAGTLPKRKTSAVIDTTLEGIHILREGDIHIQNCQSFLSRSEAETEKLVHQIMREIQPTIGKKPVIFFLYGELGAGKTYFTKFCAKQLGIKRTVVSPTFTLCNEYPFQYQGTTIYLYHIDAYRLYDAEEMEDLGIKQMLSNNSIVFIEWANKIDHYLDKQLDNTLVVKIKLSHHTPTSRQIEYAIVRQQ